MENNIKQEIQDRISAAEQMTKVINFDWFKRFFEMLESAGVKSEIIIKTMDYSLSADEFERIIAFKVNGEGLMFRNRHSIVVIENFFKYMNNMAQNYGKEKFKDFLEKTLLQIADEYEEYKKNGYENGTTLRNLFLKHLVLEHPEDVVFEYGGTPIEKMSTGGYESSISLTIAGMQIAGIKFEEVKGNLPIVIFTDFRSIGDLKKMGLGSHLFVEFCKKMVKYKQGYSVMAWNVMKGRDGEKVYSKWGAYPVKCYFDKDKDFWEIDTTPLTEEQTDEFYGEHGRLYYFSPERIKEISKCPNYRYGKQEKTEEFAL